MSGTETSVVSFGAPGSGLSESVFIVTMTLRVPFSDRKSTRLNSSH